MLVLEQFLAFIKQHQLFEPTDRVLLAVSGGKDSVFMAQLFKLAGFNFSIAHCNFNLRGEESIRDEKFVASLATRLEVAFHVVQFDTLGFAEEQQISIQMAARQLRYNWFEEIRHLHSIQYIATAHHQNDAIETCLLNLVRGTGISGLHGILPKRGALIRPLLCLTRSSIDQYIESNGIEYVEDSSNQKVVYARNALRHEVVPVLKKINPSLEDTFLGNFKRFSQMERLLEAAVSQARQEILVHKEGNSYFPISKLKLLEPPSLLLFELLKPYGFSGSVVEEVLDSLDKPSGTQFYSKTHVAVIDRTELIVSKIEKLDNSFQEVLIEKNISEVMFGNYKLTIRYADSTSILSRSNQACVDAEKLIYPLCLRTRAQGDRFFPLGMENQKKLSDYFVSMKIPLNLKDKIPLLINGNGELIWVVGMRLDNRYKVETTTKKVVIFEC